MNTSNTIKNVKCEMLGITDFKHIIDKSFDEKPIEVDKQYFYRQFFSFKRNGKKCMFCIDPVVKQNGLYPGYDWKEMEKQVIELIKNTKHREKQLDIYKNNY